MRAQFGHGEQLGCEMYLCNSGFEFIKEWTLPNSIGVYSSNVVKDLEVYRP